MQVGEMLRRNDCLVIPPQLDERIREHGIRRDDARRQHFRPLRERERAREVMP